MNGAVVTSRYDKPPAAPPLFAPEASRNGQGAHNEHVRKTEHLRENVSILGEDAHVGNDAGRVVLSDVKPEKVDWLWFARIPYGKLTVLDGDPGLGKSTMMLDIAARLTTGTPMPLERDRPPKSKVLILSAEDGLSDTMVPRLIAANADLSMIEARQTVRDDKGERLPEIPTDLLLLDIDIQDLAAKLIIIDPLFAYLGGQTNARNDQDVRRALAPLAAIAERTGAAVVVIRHLNKSLNGNAIYRGGGSIGIIGAARSGLLVAKDPDDPTERRRILASQKCNLAPPPPALAYYMETAENDTARIVWEGITEHTANGLLSGPVDMAEKPALNEACRFLRDMLDNGPKAVTELKREARNAGISDITLRRAKDMIGAKARKTAYGESGFWVWDLPTPNEQLSEDAHENPKVLTIHDDAHDDYLSEDEGGDIPF